MAHILILNGSPREQGHTAELLNEMILIFRKEGIETEPVQIGNRAIRGCMDCGGCAQSGKCVFDDDPVNEIAAKFEQADGLVVASPVYFGTPSGTVLSFLDRLFRSSGFEKKRKVGAALAVGESTGITASLEAINQYFVHGGMKIAALSCWEMDELEAVRGLARRTAEMAKALAAAKEAGEDPELDDGYVTGFDDGDMKKLSRRPVSAFLLSEDTPVFPNPRFGSDTGLLGLGGDVTVDWLLAAYSRGVFPWVEEGMPLSWWCPKDRCILIPSEVRADRYVLKMMKTHEVTLEVNRDFAATMHKSRARREDAGEETWIDDDVENAFKAMNEAGYTYSAEAFVDGELAGGTYGVKIGRCMIGESSFSCISNGSKLAMYLLAQHVEKQGILMIDAQVPSSYLLRQGFKIVPYTEYLSLMREGLKGTEFAF